MQTTSTLSQILDSLPHLSQEELQEVRKAIMALSSLDGVILEDDWILPGILEEISRRGLDETIPPRLRITNRRQFHGYLDKSKNLRNQLEKSLPGMSRSDKKTLARLVARCLAESVERFRPVTLHSLLHHVDLGIPALEEAFPGYLQAGMLRGVLYGFDNLRVAR